MFVFSFPAINVGLVFRSRKEAAKHTCNNWILIVPMKNEREINKKEMVISTLINNN